MVVISNNVGLLHFVMHPKPNEHDSLFLLQMECADVHFYGLITSLNPGLFETNDEIQFMFKGLQGYDTTELRSSKGLENHVSMVMYTLDEAIASFEDVDFVVEMLQSIGRTHWKMGGFNPDVFWKIEEPFLLAVKETLGDRYTANMDLIYKKAISFILKTLIEGFKLAERS